MDTEKYSSEIFLNAALPLLKVLAQSHPKVKKAFGGKNGIIQVSAGKTADGLGGRGTHFVVSDGALTVAKGLNPKPDVELAFKDLASLNAFFSGKSKKMPKISGLFGSFGLVVATFTGLLTMASFLGAKEAPQKSDEQKLLVKMLFFLLSSGISGLNKAGHPDVAKWAASSPDRVYAWTVDNEPELAAYIRVKAGNTKACRGTYERSKPFFTMRFDSPKSALGILLETDEMIESTAMGRLVMLGAPEFGAALGEHMKLVGKLAK